MTKLEIVKRIVVLLTIVIITYVVVILWVRPAFFP